MATTNPKRNRRERHLHVRRSDRLDTRDDFLLARSREDEPTVTFEELVEYIERQGVSRET